MERNLKTIVREIREELRAEGPDGGGYSDFFIEAAINHAMFDLAELFTIRDTLLFSTVDAQMEYDLKTLFPAVTIENIIRVVYDGNKLSGISPDEFMDTIIPNEGPVRKWFLWGEKLAFLGKIEGNKEVSLWVTRAPKILSLSEDVPETPYYADKAIKHFVIAECYRESRDYDRADNSYMLYLRAKDSVLRRGVPQRQRDHSPMVGDDYFPPFSGSGGALKSDSNPGGR